MNLYLRLLMALVTGRRSRLGYADSLERFFRVWPHDLDAFGHMNNGRYLQIMDVARVEWMTRTGVAKLLLANRWSGVLGGTLMRYRHPLRPFQRYRVTTTLIHWDERWFFFQQTFWDEAGRCVASGLSRAAVRRRGTWISTRDVADQLKPGLVPPPAPDYLRTWLALDRDALERLERPVDDEPGRALA